MPSRAHSPSQRVETEEQTPLLHHKLNEPELRASSRDPRSPSDAVEDSPSSVGRTPISPPEHSYWLRAGDTGRSAGSFFDAWRTFFVWGVAGGCGFAATLLVFGICVSVSFSPGALPTACHHAWLPLLRWECLDAGFGKPAGTPKSTEESRSPAELSTTGGKSSAVETETLALGAVAVVDAAKEKGGKKNKGGGGAPAKGPPKPNTPASHPKAQLKSLFDDVTEFVWQEAGAAEIKVAVGTREVDSNVKEVTYRMSAKEVVYGVQVHSKSGDKSELKAEKKMQTTGEDEWNKFKDGQKEKEGWKTIKAALQKRLRDAGKPELSHGQEEGELMKWIPAIEGIPLEGGKTGSLILVKKHEDAVKLPMIDRDMLVKHQDFEQLFGPANKKTPEIGRDLYY